MECTTISHVEIISISFAVVSSVVFVIGLIGVLIRQNQYNMSLELHRIEQNNITMKMVNAIYDKNKKSLEENDRTTMTALR